MPSRDKKMLCLYISEEGRAMLLSLARRMGLSQSVCVELAVRDFEKTTRGSKPIAARLTVPDSEYGDDLPF